MSHRVQMTFGFNRPEAADAFELWLRDNEGATAYGAPLFIDRRYVGAQEWVVEYSTAAKQQDFTRGIAFGCQYAASRIREWGEKQFRDGCTQACRDLFSKMHIDAKKHDALIEKLQRQSDLFCYTIQQCNPVDREGFNLAVMQTLITLDN